MANYDKTKPYVGADFPEAPDYQVTGAGEKKQWRTKEDEERACRIKENEGLFDGKHCVTDGGPWEHPYARKIDKNNEKIPYQISNLLGKTSVKFADLIVGSATKQSDFAVVSANPETQKILDGYKWRRIWASLVRASYAGYDGLQTFRDADDKVWFELIAAQNLRIIFDAKDAIKKIVKNIYFTKKVNNKTECYVYQEIHKIGYYEIHLYRVKGNFIEEELSDMSIAEEYFDFKIEQTQVETGLDDFLISIVFNELIGQKIYSDYSIAAKRTQEALNKRETTIARILDVHGNPRMLAPRNAAKEDKTTGEYKFENEGTEVFFVDEKTKDVYGYLTWEGQLEEARKERDHSIMKLCTETDMAPQLLSFYDLVASGPAETSSKLKQLLQATIVRAQRKRNLLDEALKSLIHNILKMYGVAKPDEFSITYSEIVTQMREELLREVLSRVDATLLDKITAIMRLDGVTEEEAREIYAKAVIEKTNEAPAMFGSTPAPFTALGEKEEIEEEEEEEEEAG